MGYIYDYEKIYGKCQRPCTQNTRKMEGKNKSRGVNKVLIKSKIPLVKSSKLPQIKIMYNYIHKIILLPDYYLKCSGNKTNNTKINP